MLVAVSSLTGYVQAMPAPLGRYQHGTVLTPDEFAIYWNVTSDSQLVLEIHCIKADWIGFGLSLDKTQNDGDVFVYWGYDDGKIFRGTKIF